MALKRNNGSLPPDYRPPGSRQHTQNLNNGSSSRDHYADSSWTHEPEEKKRSLLEGLGRFADVIVDFIKHPTAVKVFVVGLGIFSAVLNIHSIMSFLQEVVITPEQLRDMTATLIRLPILGAIFAYLNYLFGAFLIVVFGFLFWAVLQGCELLVRVDLFIEDAASNIIRYANDRARRETIRPAFYNPQLQRLSKISTYNPALLLIGCVIGIIVYGIECWATGRVRPWTDGAGNFTPNTFFNFWSVFGVQICILLHTIFKMVAYKGEQQAQ